MQAAYYTQTGDAAEVLQHASQPMPVPGKGEVLAETKRRTGANGAHTSRSEWS